MDKHNIVKKAKIINICAGAVMIAVGAVLCIVGTENLYAVKMLIAVMSLILGAAKILGYFSNDVYRLAFQFDLAIGALYIVLGIMSFFLYDNILITISVAAGVFVIVDALLRLQTAIDLKRFGMKGWQAMIIAGTFVALTGICIIVAANRGFFVNVVLGAAFIADGTLDVWTTVHTVKVRARKKNLELKFEIGEKNG